jgi:hypothetical protein
MSFKKRPATVGKAQSSMEYLVTWGWAIAIVTVALAGLYTLGVFGGSNSATTQRAHAGTCIIERQSTGLTSTVALTGECTNMQPQFVAQFNGESSLISVGSSPSLSLQYPFTISAWIKLNQLGGEQNIFTKTSSTAWTTNGFQFYVNSNTLRVNVYGQSSVGSSTALLSGIWYQVAITFSPPGNFILYVDGADAGSGSQTTYPSTYPIFIGNQYPGGAAPFGGDMSNLQFYNATLSAAEVQTLYSQGIGAVPVRPANVTAWWQLNGNGNDYGGLNNIGSPANVAYTAAWTSGYNIP